MSTRAAIITAVLISLLLFLSPISHAQAGTTPLQDPQEPTHTVALGDTWLALAERFDTTPQDLLTGNNTINPHRQPAVGSAITLPFILEAERYGRLLRPLAGGTLETGARNGRNPWAIALQNGLGHPYKPLLYTPLLLPDGSSPPREFPVEVENLALGPGVLHPGSAFALQAISNAETIPRFMLESEPLIVTRQDDQIKALGATGAFLSPGQYLLTIRAANHPLWEQPLTFSDRAWTWEEVTFTNTAVLDPEALRLERERLHAIWDKATPQALWQGQFISPIDDFVEISSQYGARRSVNGGPYSSYHEGTDFSAYRGSEVRAPAAGKVVLAEELAIRGGAVILDHGLGLHSGYYHLSAVHVRPGQKVAAGDLLGEVGTTGRSTGNHLHWDLLVGRTWIDPLAWLEKDLDTWLSPPPPPVPEWSREVE